MIHTPSPAAAGVSFLMDAAVTTFVSNVFAMAVTLVTTLNSVMFLTELTRLTFHTTGDTAVFSIKKEGAVTPFFATSYVPDSTGNVTVLSLHKILDTEIEDDKVGRFIFMVDGDTIGDTVTVIRCTIHLGEPAGRFVNEFFLTSSSHERDTSMRRREYLTAFCSEWTPVTVTATYLNAGYDLVKREFNVATTSVNGDGLQSVDVSPRQFTDDEAGQLVALKVRCGRRKINYRVVNHLPEADPAMIFRNCFNVWETVYLCGAKETEPKITRSTAMIDGALSCYQVDEYTQYTVKSGPLRESGVETVRDLARARTVYLMERDGSAGHRVIITDSSVKATNENTEMPDFSITYRHAEASGGHVDVYRRPRIFDKTFDSTYE